MPMELCECEVIVKVLRRRFEILARLRSSLTGVIINHWLNHP